MVKVTDGTINGDFRWLSSVFNWAHSHKVKGRRLLAENPLADVTVPCEKNVRRPVASHDRYTRTQAHTDTIDPEGRLGCILTLARFTGRRIDAICQLTVADVLLTPDRVRGTLATMGMDERLADHMPRGAIRWRADCDKMGFAIVSPISADARAAVDDYLAKHHAIGDAPLFPAPGNPAASIERRLVTRWLVKAEKVAGLPKLDRGAWHPYRRLWAVERKHLPDVDVAAAGGWRDTRALKLSYQQADPATVLAVVEGRVG